jgi:predicted CoA-binding protein
MDPAAQEFVQNKRLAIVGVSRNENKFGNAAYRELKQRGYQVFAVNPSAETLMGDRCYPDLMSLKGEVDGVVVCVPAAQGVGVLQQAAEAGIRNVWVQQMAESPELLKTGQDLGLKLVSGKCILMYAEPVQSFHKWHRGFMRLIGKL